MNSNTNHFKLRDIYPANLRLWLPSKSTSSLSTSIWTSLSITAQHPPGTNVSYLSAVKKLQDRSSKDLYLHIRDWNVVHDDGVVHLYTRYTIQASGGTIIGICNEGYGRASPETMKIVFEDADPSKASMTNDATDWYTRTSPRFEVTTADDRYW